MPFGDPRYYGRLDDTRETERARARIFTMSDDEYDDDFEGEFIWLDEVEADLAVRASLLLLAPRENG